jgi:hypothetical protein
MDTDKQRLLSTIVGIYERVAWTHKTHEKQRELCTQNASRDKWLNVGLTGLTAVSVVFSFVEPNSLGILVPVILSFLSTLFAVYRLSFSPDADALLHRHAAKALLKERDRLILLIERCMSSDAELDTIRLELQKATRRIDRIYAEAPDTSHRAFKVASKALTQSNEMTSTVAEINRLLPEDLQLKENRMT